MAVANEVANLPLESAPIDASMHALEIHVDGFDEPLVVLAEPMGPPTEEGFPLRLSPLDDAQAEALSAELFGGDAKPRAAITPTAPLSPRRRSTMPPPLTEDHVAALARTTGPSTLSRRAPGSLRGRPLGDGRFALESLIGGGASGEVYRATHAALRRPVAVKVLHPTLQQSRDYCARFYAEALAASRLDHRNVLRVIDYGQEPDGLLYIVMELLDGESLQQILDREGPLPRDRVADLLAQACAGLAHAHDAGVIHRDIKPENIVVVRRRDDDGNETELVKVCDFGIAHWTPVNPREVVETGDDDETLVMLPDRSKVVGTPAYMAPEQIRNEEVDARTDVYAVGVVLYELVTGRLPFVSESPMEILTQHVHAAPARPSALVPGVDPELENIILRALAKDPSQRQPNARALRAELRALVDDNWTSTSGLHRRVDVTEIPTAAEFRASPAEAIAKLTGVDDRTRGLAVDALAEALRGAALAGDVSVARELLGWLEHRITDATAPSEERERAERAALVLRDAAVARGLAGHLLGDRAERVGDASPLLAAAGQVAARALFDARRVQPPTLEARGRFVTCTRATGPSALPVVLAGLEPLVALGTRQDEALAEDLLRAMPEVRSDVGGELVVRFVRLDRPSIGALAVHALASLWATRAHPLLLGVLDSPVDSVRLAAVEALERLRMIDDWGVERLARIVAGQPPASEELRLAAARALGVVNPEARPRASGFLQGQLLPSQGLMTSLKRAFGAREDARMLVALARSLAAIDPGAARLVFGRLAGARAELRPELDAILEQR